jgi:hypothetical protein
MLAAILEDLTVVRFHPNFRGSLTVEASWDDGTPIARLPDSAGFAAVAPIRKMMTAAGPAWF